MLLAKDEEVWKMPIWGWILIAAIVVIAAVSVIVAGSRSQSRKWGLK